MLRTLSALKGDCRITFFGHCILLVYWIRPDHKCCSMREISNVFRPKKLVRCHFQWNGLISVTWSDTSHSCDGGNVSECGFELLIFHISYMCSFGFPLIFRNWSRRIPGMNSWRFDSRDTQGKDIMNSRGGRSTAKHRDASSTQILKPVYAARTRTWLLLVVIPRSADCSCVLSNSATSCSKWTQ